MHQVVQRRVDLMRDEGVVFVTNANVGDTVSPKQLLENLDALLLCTGSTRPRDLPIKGNNIF